MIKNLLYLSIYSLCLFATPNAFSASKDKEGMPQLDVSTYPSLIFWLILTFGFTFLVLKFFITPKLSEILNQRKERISADLFAAKSSREEAENSKMNQEKSISDAKNNANKIVKDAIEKTKIKLNSREIDTKEAEKIINEFNKPNIDNRQSQKSKSSNNSNLAFSAASLILCKTIGSDAISMPESFLNSFPIHLIIALSTSSPPK